MGTVIRIGYVLNYIFSRDIAGRTVAKLPDDRFLVAYPGSGGQWLRTLVGNLMHSHSPITDANLLERIPDLYHKSRRSFKQMTSPRVIFSHECYDADYHGPVVYLVRDPRDVAVSMYEQRRRGMVNPDPLTFPEFMSSVFMRTDQYQGGWAEDSAGVIHEQQGFLYRCRLKEEFLGTPASWGENVMSWLGARGEDPKSMLIVRYEDLFSNTENVLRKVAEFLSMPATADGICTSIKASGEVANYQWLQPPGKWKTDLPLSAAREIEAAWGELMLVLGYFPGTHER